MPQPLRAMLDTCVYEHLALDENLFSKFDRTKSVSVYGCKVIREQLRDTPMSKTVGGRKIRVLMLSVYDRLVGKHVLPAGDISSYLAIQYLNEYKGNQSREKMLGDFVIVAVASIGKLDIICTEDSRTMASKDAIAAYTKVNDKNGLRYPKLITLKEIEKSL